ncbi:MAG: Ig-like domain-containing protein [Longimicrobiales bacterium]
MRLRWLVSLSALALLLVSCSGSDIPTQPPTPVATTITLSASSLSFTSLGQSQQLTATVADQKGQLMASANVAWTSSSTAVVNVSAAGLVTSVGIGTASISATSGSASANVSASVQQLPASVSVSPDSLVLRAPGDTATLKARVQDGGGADVVGASVTWVSSDSTTVTVSNAGLVTAVANGPAAVTAQAGGLKATVIARVRGSSIAVTVTGDGDPLKDVAVWLTDPAGVARKDTTDVQGKALFRNLKSGEHTVTLQQTPTGLEVSSAQKVQVGEDQRMDVAFIGRFAPAQVLGRATAWGKPVVGAKVRLEGRDTTEVTVDSVGTFRVDSISRGDYKLRIFSYDPNAVRFRETIVSQFLASKENLIEFFGRPATQPTWTSISAGWYHACGVTSTHEAYCWGQNVEGQLGDGTSTWRLYPALVAGDHEWASISAGYLHTCGVTTGGAAYCWGRGSYGKLGDGSGLNQLSPVAVSGGHTWAAVLAGGYHTCGVTTGGTGYCWGYNNHGAGGNVYGNRAIPSPVDGDLKWSSISPGFLHTCGVTTAAAGYCWGEGPNGELGDGTRTAGRFAPGPVAGNLVFKAVSADDNHSCGLSDTGHAFCWGRNGDGRLGDGTTLDRLSPVAVTGGHTFVALSASNAHTCGLNPFGEAYCWGSAPALLGGGHQWSQVEVGNGACGLTTGGSAYCWWGTLGDGTANGSSVPVRVGGEW